MALFEDLDPSERDHPLTARLRQEIGVVEFARQLRLGPDVVHAAAKAAFESGDRAQHERLLHIGWLLNRLKLRRAGNANVR